MVAVVGCGERQRSIALVTGTVTLDGKPLANASVRFIPMDDPNEPLGVVSIGETDAQGHFRLATSDDRPGAVVGQHAVQISTLKARRVPNSESTEITSPEKIPEHYNTQTQLQFTVPGQGTDKANFDLKS
jgi:hypothetical protein